MSLAAARASKHVYCEKPLGLSVEQCLAAREITQSDSSLVGVLMQSISFNGTLIRSA